MDLGPDKFARDGKFTFKFVYDRLAFPNFHSDHQLWNLWKISGRLRSRDLIWKILRGGLLMNDYCLLRGVVDSNVCLLCGLEPKIELHLLKDCLEVKLIWEASKVNLMT